MKTKFDLEFIGLKATGTAEIIGKSPDHLPYMVVTVNGIDAFVKDKDLELMAVNILKALDSKKLST